MINSLHFTLYLSMKKSLILFLFLCSCTTKTETASDSTSAVVDSTATSAVDTSVVDSAAAEPAVSTEQPYPELLTYCCGNHSPEHCGNRYEIDDLSKLNSCKDFSAIKK